MKMKKTLSLLLMLVVLTAGMTACKDDDKASVSADMTLNKSTAAYKNEAEGFQTSLPKDGEEVAVLHTNMGDVYIRLFPEAAPKTVKNFKQLITDKYYDGLIFHRVIKDFMIQGGDPTGNGTGGKSIYGDKFEDEFDSTVLNIRGSLAMANSGPNSNGSQFFINQATSKQTDWKKLKQESVAQFADMEKQFEKAYSQKYNNWKKMFYDNCGKKGMPIATAIPDSAWKSYAENGSNMNLDGAWRTGGGHTVFGQVYEGLDVVDKIAGVKTGTGDKPAEDVKIVTAEIIKYQAK